MRHILWFCWIVVRKCVLRRVPSPCVKRLSRAEIEIPQQLQFWNEFEWFWFVIIFSSSQPGSVTSNGSNNNGGFSLQGFDDLTGMFTWDESKIFFKARKSEHTCYSPQTCWESITRKRWSWKKSLSRSSPSRSSWPTSLPSPEPLPVSNLSRHEIHNLLKPYQLLSPWIRHFPWHNLTNIHFKTMDWLKMFD